MLIFPKFKVKWLLDNDLGVTSLFILAKDLVFRELSTSKFWEDLLHKLSNFYDNCVAPEVVSPVHSFGLPMRNLSKK